MREDKMKNDGQLVRKSTRISVMNTSEDIARILMAEITGDAYAGKAALYNLARMFLEQQDIADQTQALEDVVEYLLIVGSAAHRTSPQDITQYLQVKRGISLMEEDFINKPNKKFRQLLHHVILNIKNPETDKIHYNDVEEERALRFEDIVNELNLIYKAILMGSCTSEEITSRPEKSIGYIPPPVSKASHALLTNFPILQRIELNTYKDIIAGIEIDMLLDSLEQTYRNQIRNFIERRIDEILQYRERKETPEPRKCTPPEILLQAKIGYLVSRGIQAITPRISMKHFADDYERAVLSAVSLMRAKYSDNYHKFIEWRRKEKFNAYMALYNDREAYLHLNRDDDFNYDEKMHGFKSRSNLEWHIKEVVETAPTPLSSAQTLLLSRVIEFVAKRKVEVNNWKEFFEHYKARIQNIDDIGMILLAYVSGMNVHSNVKFLDNDTEKAWKDRKKQIIFNGIGITNFISKNQLANRLQPERIEDIPTKDSQPYSGSKEMYFPLSNFNRAVGAMITTYVNNKVLSQLHDSNAYELQHFLRWNSPSRLCYSYTPQDKLIARELMERYPIFSQIPPLSPDDITNGIVLHVLQKQLRDLRVDHSITITQNLAIWQLYYMNKMVDGAKK